jgi:hypothetical protein
MHDDHISDRIGVDRFSTDVGDDRWRGRSH